MSAVLEVQANVYKFSKRKIKRLEETISELEKGDFSSGGGSGALVQLREAFNQDLTYLESLRANGNWLSIKDFSDRLNLKFDHALNACGMILRSSNVRNAFELYYPMEGIVRSLLGSDIKIILSSEWDYIPFTYPLTLTYLRNFIFVGLPVTEAGGTFFVPLGMHEIGHTVWQNNQSVREVMEDAIEDAVKTVFSTRIKEISRILNIDSNKNQSHFELYELQSDVERAVLSQAEELFCDYLGVIVFRKAYLYSFVEYMCPGEAERASVEYPTITDRIHAISCRLKEIDGNSVKDFSPLFIADVIQANKRQSLMAELSDQVRKSVDDSCFAEALKLVKDAGLFDVSHTKITAARTAFQIGVPFQGASLSELLIAAWECRERILDASDDMVSLEEERLLDELVLKSLELQEVEDYDNTKK